jgi:glycerate-2-kinase
LYISDVNGKQLSTIASDPSGPDETTLEEFYQIVERYDLLSKLPAPVSVLISERLIPETPKDGDDCFRNFQRHLLIYNQTMLVKVTRLITSAGWSTAVDFSDNEVHYRLVADRLLTILRDRAIKNPGKPLCLVSGGEVICPVSGDGVGGRNQEFALYCATQLNELFPDSEVAVLSAGTDGIDGNSDAAGAVVDRDTVSSLATAQEYLNRNDSYHYLNMVGDVIITGPTGTNVRDLRLLFLRPNQSHN